MSSVVWPDSLPQNIRVADHDASFPEGWVRTQMDNGPAKVRARFTAAPENHSSSLLMDSDQLQTFMDFWKSSIRMGSLPFEWTDPRTGTAAMVRFTAKPTYGARTPRMVTAGVWEIQVAIEVLPDAVNPARPEDVLPPDTELGEWGPWYHAFDPSPAGEVDAAFMGTTPDLGIASGGGDSGGGGISNQGGWGGVPGASSGHVINNL